MKKLFTLLLIGLTFIGCQKDKEIETVYVNNPQVNCNCGEVESSTNIFAFGGASQTVIIGDCGSYWSGMTTDMLSGRICEWEVETLDGSPANW